MAPEERGRRRWRSMASLPVVLIVLCLLRPANGAVFSIDLGSEWMKVAVVNLKPGQAPIAIAINEMSKRKSPALVAFSNGDRLLAEEAAGIVARYPERVYSRVRDMIGKPFESVKQTLDASYLPFDVIKDDRGAVSIRTHDKQSVFRSEELLAMVLSYGRDLAEAHAKGVIKDAIITVPPYLGQAERQGILDAAQIAGITVLGLINEHSGAALQYGIDKDFGNETKHVVFYDMGANSLYAAVVYYSAYSGKERGKTTSFNQFQVKGIRWDATLGGQTMEARLVDYFAKEFNAQVGMFFDVRKHPKAMAKLKKQVKRTKEILSANTEAPLSVEALHDDRDFRSTITRKKFEELCSDLWERALNPLKDVLADAGLKVEDVNAVELIGGATRVPKLQAVLSDFLGKKNLDRHLDADEAVVLGASLQAANLSDGFKLNRKLGMIDGASYSILMELDGASPGALENVDNVLVHRLKKIPSKAYRALKNQKSDFKVALKYDATLLPPGVISPEVATYQITGVADAANKYASYNVSAPLKTSLHFSLSRSGVISLDKAETVVEISEWYEVPVANATTDVNATVEAKSTEEGAGSPEEAKDEEVKLSSEEVKQTQADSSPEAGDVSGVSSEGEPSKDSPVAEPVVKKKLRRRTIRIPLKIKDLSKGPNMRLSEKDIKEAVARMEKLHLKDAEKRKTAEAKNSLEAYIYATKDKLESLEGIETVSTEEQRDSLRAELNEAEDWLYTDGEDATAAEFKKKLDGLKKSGDAIFSRLDELIARPAAVSEARTYLKTITETLEEWEESKPWIPVKSKDDVRKEVESLRQWLDDMESKQSKLSGHVEPAFTSDLVYTEVSRLRGKVLLLSKLQKPKPKVEKPTENIEAETKPSESSQVDDTAKQEEKIEETVPQGEGAEMNQESKPTEHDEL
ncbi:hypoxia up-regulated 1 [Marchantia polymorpha subsp. ruderalis]